MNKIENYWNILIDVSDSVKFAETKAVVLLSTYGILATILTAKTSSLFNIVGQNISLIVLFIISSLTFLLAVYYAFKCLRPNFKHKSEDSIMFFNSIKQNTNESYFEKSQDILNSEIKFQKQLSEQIVTKSKIISIKFKFVNLSVVFFLVFLISMLLLTIISFINN